MANTSTIGDLRPLPTSQGTYARWYIDSGTFDHITSCKTNFYSFRPVPKVWVKGFCTYAEGECGVKDNMRDLSGQAVASYFNDVQYVSDLGRRACYDEHRLFSVSKARDVGHYIVFEDLAGYIQVHDASRCSFQVSLRRHGELIWLDTEMCRPNVTSMFADASLHGHLMPLRLGHLGNSAMDQLQRS